jgi:hypothetical protein
MRTKRIAAVLPLCAGLAMGTASASDLFIYPTQGQSQDQQDRDRYECHQWASQQTGFDPMTASAPTASTGAQEGGVLRGGARGAATGAVVGAIAGDAGKGAAAGAAGGAMIGGMRRRDATRRQQSAEQSQQAAYDAKRAEHRRAMSVCLEGRGYSVK